MEKVVVTCAERSESVAPGGKVRVVDWARWWIVRVTSSVDDAGGSTISLEAIMTDVQSERS